jgi:hypothetical protein
VKVLVKKGESESESESESEIVIGTRSIDPKNRFAGRTTLSLGSWSHRSTKELISEITCHAYVEQRKESLK